MKNNLNALIKELAQQKFINSFNPYNDICKEYDICNANIIRLNNLKNYLKYFSNINSIDLWIGRDLGYKGGRRTGIPFTSENNIHNINTRLNLDLKTSSKQKKLESEVSANTIWFVFNNISKDIMFWNIYPYHPHAPNNQFTNRKFNKEEEIYGLKVLETIINSFNINQIICIGNDAEKSLKKINIANIPVICVRHPSYGGVNIFKSQMSKIYNIKSSQQSELFND